MTLVCFVARIEQLRTNEVCVATTWLRRSRIELARRST